MTVLPAKLRPVALSPDCLPRGRIHRLLEPSAELPLTVLEAAAGAGKTTALAGWLAVTARPVAWLSLDTGDDDPRRLLAGVTDAFGTVLGADVTAPVRQRIEDGADLTFSCLALLAQIVEQNRRERLVLVLDDYHLLRTPAVHELMCTLVDQLSPLVPTLIASRTKPPLRVARRLAAREATVISADQLAFNGRETEALLNQIHGLDLNAGELGLVASRLHGWPVGLALFILSMADANGRRTGVGEAIRALAAGPMVDYLIEEDIAHAGDRQARLRLYSSVLERVNGPLAVAMMDDPDAAALLEELREQGHFIASADAPGGWLSIHDLMRMPLQMALARSEPGMAATIRERASEFFEQTGMIGEAVHNAVCAENSPRVDELLLRHAMTLAMARQTSVLRRALAVPPGEGGALVPFRNALTLLVQLLDGVHQAGLADRAWELYNAHPDDLPVQIVTAILVATPFGGDVERGVRVGREATERFAEVPEFAISIAPGIAGCLLFAGRVGEARALAEPLITTGRAPAQIFAHAFLARINLVEGDPATAEWHGRRAVELLEQFFTDSSGDFVWVRAALADALRVNGHLAEARIQLDRSLEAERRRPGSVIQAVLLISDAELCLAEGRRSRARTSLRRGRQIYANQVNVGVAAWGRLEAIEADLTAPVASAATGSMPTPAELRVLEMLVHTPSRAVIAQGLFLSEATVKSHLRRIYRRLGVSRREDALAAARARGLLAETPPVRAELPVDASVSAPSATQTVS